MLERVSPAETLTLQDRKRFLERQISTLVNTPDFTSLANMFGSGALPTGNHEKLRALQALASERWDYRRGAERQAVMWHDAPESKMRETVLSIADTLGLDRNTSPENKRPTFLVILGGANSAPFNRLRYGLERVEDFDYLVYLGSSRPLPEAEKKRVESYAPHAQTEAQLGDGAFKTAFPNATLIDTYDTVRHGDVWGMHFYELPVNDLKKPGFVLSTPQQLGGIGGRRATTYDNFRFFRDRAELSKNPKSSVVSVTTGLHTTEQHFAALQELTLPCGTTVETIGHDTTYSGMPERTSTEFLQAFKATIDAAVRLQDELKSS